jgi:dTDP-glucose pyrophosphorylase
MSIAMPRKAMLFAAGAGSRMRPLTERTAKPLLTVDGRSIWTMCWTGWRRPGCRRWW